MSKDWGVGGELRDNERGKRQNAKRNDRQHIVPDNNIYLTHSRLEAFVLAKINASLSIRD